MTMPGADLAELPSPLDEQLAFELTTVFNRFDHVLLTFSGGKESVTLAHAVEQWADRVTLIWLNTCDSADGLPEFVRKYQTRFRLIEVVGNPHASWDRHGYPADVVTVSSMLPNELGRKFQPRLSCCALGRNLPLYREVERVAGVLRNAGVKVAHINGQRREDLAYSRDDPEFTYAFPPPFWPLWDWCEADVMQHIESKRIKLAPHYSEVRDSMDCVSCPAGLTVDRLRYLERNRPHTALEVRQIAFESLATAMTGLKMLSGILHAPLPTENEAIVFKGDA